MEETTMKHTKNTLWYNPAAKSLHSTMQEGGDAAGMEIERLLQSQQGRSLLESYCRLYSSKR